MFSLPECTIEPTSGIALWHNIRIPVIKENISVDDLHGWDEMRAALQEAFTFRPIHEETEEMIDTTARANTKDTTFRFSTLEEDEDEDVGNYENLHANGDDAKLVEQDQ